MADQCYIIEDALYASETWRLSRSELIADTGHFGEELTGTRIVVIREHGTLADAIDGNRTLTIGDSRTFGEQYQLLGTQRVVLSDVLRARDAWKIGQAEDIAEAGNFAEAYSGRARTVLRELGQFTEAYTPVGAPSAMLSDHRAFRDRLTSVRGESIAEVGTFDEALAARRSATLADTGTLADLLAPSAKAIVMLRESAAWSDAFMPHSKPRAMLADDGWAEERYLLPPLQPRADGHTAHRVGSATGWTANTDTWAMSRYTEWPITSLAVVDGVLHGTAEDGLYRLEVTDDAGEPINAHITTGQQDYLAEQTKGVNVLYVGAVTDGRLQVTTDVAPKGLSAFFTYPFEERHAEDFAPQRAKLARGVRSRYWQFTIGNVEGADFTIDTVSVNAVPDSRRV